MRETGEKSGGGDGLTFKYQCVLWRSKKRNTRVEKGKKGNKGVPERLGGSKMGGEKDRRSKKCSTIKKPGKKRET